ncbi:MAG: 16S rRNA (guanine(527)-N(7))-methyltransferase RsmG [Pseudobutyrivibrio sp.]|nr:16S rRNA (guanine(527)-N(7))-methyltransferase RsmG [Pseudobutyrivibrio sp.]
MNRDYSYLINACNSWHLDIDDDKINKLDIFYDMLIEKNKVMNLTAITDFDEVLVKHFVDSLSICQVMPDSINTICDLGTGAGFPGIVLAIFYPEISFTLIDSLNKRINFLSEVVQAIGLNNIELIHARAEEIGRNKDYRESFDLVVSRAVANISTLSEYCTPLVKVNGYFISYKSVNVKEEITAAGKTFDKLAVSIKDTFEFVLPDTDMSRSFIIIKKIKNTPKAYPRKAGTPSKEPLS